MGAGFHSTQRGVAAVEFAVVVILLFTLIFGVLELARMVYMYNTLQEITRSAARAAANTDFRSASALNQVRQRAVFRNSPGLLVFGDPVTDEHVRIDYLSIARQGNGPMTITEVPAGSLPGCPSRNRHNCLNDPSGNTCIRLVRVRVCEPGDSAQCNRVGYRTAFPFISLPVPLPIATTVVSAETLGYAAGDPLCQ
jgi:hypothetical protein